MTRAVPGAKRGRPPRKSGRSKSPLAAHPDRYTIAILDAVALALCDANRTAASVVTAAERFGRRSGVISASLTYPLPELIADDFNRVSDRVRAMAAWYAKDARDLAWRKAMGRAIGYAMAAAAAGPEWRAAHPFAADVIVAHAAKAGEASWARRILLPLMLRDPADDWSALGRKMTCFLDGVPNFSHNRDERIMQIIVDFYVLKVH